MSKSADRYNGDSLISLQKRLVSAAFILLLFFLCLAQALTEEDPKARAEVQKVIEYPGDSWTGGDLEHLHKGSGNR